MYNAFAPHDTDPPLLPAASLSLSPSLSFSLSLSLFLPLSAAGKQKAARQYRAPKRRLLYLSPSLSLSLP